MAFTIYSSKDNQWREYLNPLRGLTLERIVQYIEQGEQHELRSIYGLDAAGITAALRRFITLDATGAFPAGP